MRRKAAALIRHESYFAGEPLAQEHARLKHFSLIAVQPLGDLASVELGCLRQDREHFGGSFTSSGSSTVTVTTTPQGVTGMGNTTGAPYAGVPSFTSTTQTTASPPRHLFTLTVLSEGRVIQALAPPNAPAPSVDQIYFLINLALDDSGKLVQTGSSVTVVGESPVLCGGLPATTP